MKIFLSNTYRLGIKELWSLRRDVVMMVVVIVLPGPHGGGQGQREESQQGDAAGGAGQGGGLSGHGRLGAVWGSRGARTCAEPRLWWPSEPGFVTQITRSCPILCHALLRAQRRFKGAHAGATVSFCQPPGSAAPGS